MGIAGRERRQNLLGTEISSRDQLHTERVQRMLVHLEVIQQMGVARAAHVRLELEAR